MWATSDLNTKVPNSSFKGFIFVSRVLRLHVRLGPSSLYRNKFYKQILNCEPEALNVPVSYTHIYWKARFVVHTNRDFEEKEIQMIKKINALKTHINILLNALPHKSAGIQGLKRTALKHKNKNCIKTTSLTGGIPVPHHRFHSPRWRGIHDSTIYWALNFQI